MFSLDWVKEKAQVMGSAHLINDYVEYGEILDKEVFRFTVIFYFLFFCPSLVHDLDQITNKVILYFFQFLLYYNFLYIIHLLIVFLL